MHLRRSKATMNTAQETGQLSEITVAHRPATTKYRHIQMKTGRKLVAVVATPNEHRNTWQEKALSRVDMRVVITSSDIQCIEAMHNERPDVLILEVKRNWECPKNVLRARNVMHHFRQIPVVLISRDGVSSEAYQLSTFIVQGFYSRMPDIDALSNWVSRLCEVQSNGGDV